jgi:hypothetical protein
MRSCHLAYEDMSTPESVWKVSWLLTMKFINENICSQGRSKISDHLNMPLHEFLGLSSSMILIFFWNINNFLLLNEWKQKIFGTSLQSEKDKINCFATVSVARMQHWPNCMTFKPASGHVGFCDGQKWRWGRFSPRTSVSPANLYCNNFSTITITYHPGMVQ